MNQNKSTTGFCLSGLGCESNKRTRAMGVPGLGCGLNMGVFGARVDHGFGCESIETGTRSLSISGVRMRMYKWFGCEFKEIGSLGLSISISGVWVSIKQRITWGPSV